MVRWPRLQGKQCSLFWCVQPIRCCMHGTGVWACSNCCDKCLGGADHQRICCRLLDRSAFCVQSKAVMSTSGCRARLLVFLRLPIEGASSAAAWCHGLGVSCFSTAGTHKCVTILPHTQAAACTAADWRTVLLVVMLVPEGVPLQEGSKGTALVFGVQLHSWTGTVCWLPRTGRYRHRDLQAGQCG